MLTGLAPRVTIVVVPRERFSFALASLASIYEATPPPFDLVYVDAGAPAAVNRALDGAAAARGFRLLRHPRYLWPNQARNLGARGAATEFVAFVDNDVVVRPGWLDALVGCADATGAAVVGPLCLQGIPEARRVHIAGGTLRVLEGRRGRTLEERHRHAGADADAIAGVLARGPCDVVEFHTMLVRTAVLAALGGLDEQLLNTREHVDFCLAVRAQGGSVWFEPGAEMSYVPPPPFAWSDVPFFLHRWSPRASKASLRYFAGKWGLTVERLHRKFLRRHRRRLLRGLLGWPRPAPPVTGAAR
jgi:GT2 family glycosyltransferase